MLKKIIISFSIFIIFSGLVSGAYLFGYSRGVREARNEELAKRQSLLSQFVEILSQRKVASLEKKEPTPTPTFTPPPTVARPTAAPPPPSWGGPELWEVVNKRRVELGVNPLSQRDELCTIASIRLNRLLELGKLDAHEGFSNLKEQRPDLAGIFEKYGTLAEFLISGAQSPDQAVSLWENTLGHKKLMTGGEYVWGCIYAQNGFGVAITAF